MTVFSIGSTCRADSSQGLSEKTSLCSWPPSRSTQYDRRSPERFTSLPPSTCAAWHDLGTACRKQTRGTVNTLNQLQNRHLLHGCKQHSFSVQGGRPGVQHVEDVTCTWRESAHEFWWSARAPWIALQRPTGWGEPPVHNSLHASWAAHQLATAQT